MNAPKHSVPRGKDSTADQKFPRTRPAFSVAKGGMAIRRTNPNPRASEAPARLLSFNPVTFQRRKLLRTGDLTRRSQSFHVTPRAILRSTFGTRLSVSRGEAAEETKKQAKKEKHKT